MKVLIVLLTTALVSFGAETYSQNNSFTFRLNNATILEVLAQIEEQSDMHIAYDVSTIDTDHKIDLAVEGESVEEVLKKALKNTDLSYRIMNRYIIISKNESNYSVPASQQHVKISGKASDSSGISLPGVSVTVKGTTQGTITDANGNYSLTDIPPNTTLIFSFVGMKKLELDVSGKTFLNVELEEETIGLEEVVAIGYGVQKKVSLTSAVEAVGGDELIARPSPTLSNKLQGMLPGLTVIDRGGLPGDENMSIRVRGVTTLTNNNPLVIVDGIEQSFEQLAPEDIESISLLKDAASTAIYGSRAGNGVLLITTRRGTSNQTNVSYNGFVSFQNATNLPEHMDTESYLRLQNLAYQNRGSNPIYSEEDIQKYVDGSDRLKYPLPNDWFDVVLRENAPLTSHIMTVSGGSEKIKTLLSVSYYDQQGIYPSHSSERIQARINNDFIVSEFLTLSVDANYRRSNSTKTNQTDLFHRMIHSSQFTVPVFPDGTYGLSKQNHNPLAYTDPAIAGSTESNDDYLVLNSKALFSLAKNLKYTFQYGLTNDKTARLIKNPRYEIRDYWNPEIVKKSNNVNTVEEFRSENIQTTWNNLLTYDLRVENHEVNVLAGFSQIKNDFNDISAAGRNFYNNDILDLGQSEEENRDIGSQYTDWRLRSYFGRANYAYKEKYLMEFNMRYDGSSRFPRGQRYTFFPSVSGGWRISEEMFWNGLKDEITALKLRGSWGESGNQNIGLYSYFENLYVGNYYAFNGVSVAGVRQNDIASRNLTWETTSQYNIGLDAGFIQNRLSWTFDYFNKQTKGILLDLPIPGTVGLNPVPSNAGKVENKGWESQLSWKDRKGELVYEVSVNVSDVKNKVKSLNGTGPYYSGEHNRHIIKEGLPIEALWGYRAKSLLTDEDIDADYPTVHSNPHAGDIKYLDLKTDQIINNDDKTFLGSVIPRYTFMLNGNVRYKNLDMNIQFQGVGKVNVLLQGALIENGSWEGFTLSYGKDYWTEENLNARFPRPNKQSSHNTTNPSEWWVVDGSYIRLKNLQIGYTLPTLLTRKLMIKSARFYVSGTNLFTISGLNDWGLDAETPTGRGDYYPQISLYTVGLNLNF